MRALWLFAALLSGCGLLTPFSVRNADDGGVADGDGDADGDVERDGDADGGVDADGDTASGPGPLVMVASKLSLAADRRCDVDGDGEPDSTVAELGAEGADLFTAALNAILGTALNPGRYMFFVVPDVADVSGPDAASARIAVGLGLDSDEPRDTTDDLSGHEPLYSGAFELDRHGEPLYVCDGVRLDRGDVSGGTGEYPLIIDKDAVVVDVAELGGTIEPGGVSFELWICGAITVPSAGGVVMALGYGDHLTVLEWLLQGGAAFGVDAIPGLQPDLDLDGDGLERFVLSEHGELEQCVDGDRTVIEGRDCWQDERIADGFSITMEVSGVAAEWAGRQPGWEYRVAAGGTMLPPEESFFSTVMRDDGECAELEARCDPRLAAPCCDSRYRCSGANALDYRCYAPCEPSVCSYGDLLGSCVSRTEIDVPVCMPVGSPLPEASCTIGTLECTTEHGVSESTGCVSFEDRPACVERCYVLSPGCGDDRWCVPRAFEPGGLCAFSRGFLPDT